MLETRPWALECHVQPVITHFHLDDSLIRFSEKAPAGLPKGKGFEQSTPVSLATYLSETACRYRFLEPRKVPDAGFSSFQKGAPGISNLILGKPYSGGCMFQQYFPAVSYRTVPVPYRTALVWWHRTEPFPLHPPLLLPPLLEG